MIPKRDQNQSYNQSFNQERESRTKPGILCLMTPSQTTP